MEDGFSLKDSTIGIIGLGLMGGSLAMRLKGKCARLVGFDSHRPTLETALSKGIIDLAESESANLIGKADILILATPVSMIINILQQLPSFASQRCIVMDMGSTKRDILQTMSALPEYFDPIGGHPICGKEKLGIENADANLYTNAPFVITPLKRTSQRARSAVKQIVFAVGANFTEMTAEEHDRILASTSHLPFLLSSALVNIIPQKFVPFIGPGFRSASRLAGTPSQMMLGILKSNRDNVLRAIRKFRTSLDEIESALRSEDDLELENLLHRSRNVYLSILEHENHPYPAST